MAKRLRPCLAQKSGDHLFEVGLSHGRKESMLGKSSNMESGGESGGFVISRNGLLGINDKALKKQC